MWTVTASVDRKNWETSRGWTYILRCADQQLAYDDAEFCERMRDTQVYMVVAGSALAENRLESRDWNLDDLVQQKKFSPETGAAWIVFRDAPSSLYINVLLGTADEAVLTGILDEALRAENLLVQFSLDIHFSAVENNHQVSWPTVTRFLAGEAAFASGPPSMSLVRRHP